MLLRNTMYCTSRGGGWEGRDCLIILVFELTSQDKDDPRMRAMEWNARQPVPSISIV